MDTVQAATTNIVKKKTDNNNNNKYQKKSKRKRLIKTEKRMKIYSRFRRKLKDYIFAFHSK